MFRRFFSCAVLLGWPCVLALLSGCASTPLPLASAPADPATRLVLLELPPTVAPQTLQRLYGKDDDHALDEPALARLRQDIQQRFDIDLQAALKEAGLALSVTRLPDTAGLAVGQPVAQPALQALQAAHPARYYLRLSVSDFGETPRSWMDSYVIFEVTTTGAITAWLYSNPPTRALAGVYLAQETLEEVAEGYSGFWLVNRLSRPVRIGEDLVGRDGQVLWQGSETGQADWRWTNLWHMDEARRQALLDASLQRAARKVAQALKTKP
ncbi:MAG: hypothetical protein KGM83_10435 [Betaproteobacteria bacterium]|nr:hypothetical protein [Betaproteobacteria bacterium]